MKKPDPSKEDLRSSDDLKSSGQENLTPFQALIVAAMGLYVIACLLPGIDILKYPYPPRPRLGYECLIWGWLANSASGLFLPAWWANPVALAGLIGLIFRKRPFATHAFTLAVILAASLMLFQKFMIPEHTHGSEIVPFKLRIGYFLWLGSMICFRASINFTSIQKTQNTAT